jgi:hypothetical protein
MASGILMAGKTVRSGARIEVSEPDLRLFASLSGSRSKYLK